MSNKLPNLVTLLTLGGRIIVQKEYSLATLDLTKEQYVAFVCSEAVESKFLKQETIRTVIVPPTVSGLLC